MPLQVIGWVEGHTFLPGAAGRTLSSVPFMSAGLDTNINTDANRSAVLEECATTIAPVRLLYAPYELISSQPETVIMTMAKLVFVSQTGDFTISCQNGHHIPYRGMMPLCAGNLQNGGQVTMCQRRQSTSQKAQTVNEF